MKAAYLEATGAPDVIRFGDLPAPVPQAGEVLVKVTAAALNPVDTYIRAGAIAMPLPKPYIPGCDFAGVVEDVGEGVTGFRIGDRVWGSNQGVGGRQGTFAEYVCAPEAFTYSTPENVTDADAAANALVGITAWLGLFLKANLVPGELVCVSGATGGVGSMVVQMAKACGSNVVALAGNSRERARELGADHVLSYSEPDMARAIEGLNVGLIDVWYETQPPSDFERTIACMNQNGRIITMAGRGARPIFPNGPFYVKNLSLVGFMMFAVSAELQQQAADDMIDWMSEGSLRSNIGATFPLERAADAHRLQEDNTIHKKGTLTGKIVVAMD